LFYSEVNFCKQGSDNTEEPNNFGLAKNHAYAVIRVLVLLEKGQEKPQLLAVILKCPWSKDGFKGSFRKG